MLPDEAKQLPYIWFIGFPRIHQLNQARMLLEQQHPIRAALRTILFGRPPLTFDRILNPEKYQDEVRQAQKKRAPRFPLDNFPYDIRFLSPKSVKAASNMGKVVAKSGKPNPWPPDRIRAALGKDILAKRASHDKQLWEKYQKYIKAGYTVTQAVLYKWAKEFWYLQALDPPGYVIDYCRRYNVAHGDHLDPKTYWYSYLERVQPGVVKELEQSLEQSWHTPLPPQA